MSNGSFTVEKNTLEIFFQALSNVIPECRVHISKSGIYAITTNYENIMLIRIAIDKFKSFECNSKEETQLILDVSAISSVVKKITGNLARFSWDDHSITIEIGRATLNFNISFDAFKKDPKEPTIKLGKSFTLSGELFFDALKIAERQSEKCRIRTTKNDCYLEWWGDASKSKYLLSPECQTDIEETNYGIASLLYIAEPLKHSEMTLNFLTDMPIRIMSNDKNGLPEGLCIIYLLARG